MNANKMITPAELAQLRPEGHSRFSERSVQRWCVKSHKQRKREVKNGKITFSFRQAKSSAGGGKSGRRYEILLESLPAKYLSAYYAAQGKLAISDPTGPNDTGFHSVSDEEEFAEFESYPRNLKDRALDRESYLDEIKNWRDKDRKHHWAERHHVFPTMHRMPSGPTVRRWKGLLQTEGRVGLIPGWKGRRSSVPAKAGEIFDSLALQESEPSLNDCYKITVGIYAKEFPGVKLPGLGAFERRFKKEYPKAYRDLARKGPQYYRQHHEYNIPRDASNIAAGKGWYSDHHQLDIIVASAQGRTFRPWATVWRDVRTGKMLSCYLHEEAPNSDHIFYSFYLAVKEFGLPDFIYIDNGKDYRSRDFTGISRRNLGESDILERKARSLMGLLGVKVIFATPYNAQAKAVERDFRKIINQFCKFIKGYTGSNPASRPEATAKHVAGGEIITFEECQNHLKTYLQETFNKQKSNGRLLKGLSPDQAWAEYRTDIRTVSEESLRLCMMRTSKSMRVGRNGVVDRELGIELRYWAEWMLPIRGDYVYIRRDLENYGEAWVWRDKDNVYLGKAALAESIALHATGEIEREKLKEEIRRKRADLKGAREAIKPKIHLDTAEIIEGMSQGVAILNEQSSPTDKKPPASAANAPVSSIQTTPLDLAHAEENRRYKQGMVDTSLLLPQEPVKKPKLALFECDFDADGEEYGTGTEG